MKKKRVSVHHLIEKKRKPLFCYGSIKTEEDKKKGNVCSVAHIQIHIKVIEVQ